MDLLQLSTWSTVLRMAATECSGPIASFKDPVQAFQSMYLQNAKGDNIQVITNDGELYWLVSASLAAKLYQANFYPMLDVSHLPAQE